MKNKAKSFAFDSLKGVTLGVSVAIPGLSAGTIAVSERCYDTIIDSITSLRKDFKKSFLTLLPFLLGGAIGAILAFIGIKKGYDAAPFSLVGLFAGFILGSVPVVLKELKRSRDRRELFTHIFIFLLCLCLTAGIGIASALGGLNLEKYMVKDNVWMYFLVFFAGIITAIACVVPGISGSMTLMVFGLYQPLLSLYIGEKSIFNNTERITVGISYAFVIAIGGLIGLIIASKLMKKLLFSFRVTTFYGILGLVIGSLISMFINGDIYPLYQSNSIKLYDYILGGVLILISASISLSIFFLDEKMKKKKESVLNSEKEAKDIEEENKEDKQENL